MKLYTRRGDDGGTDLFGGRRTAKDALRIEAIGAVDELNALIGLAAACPGPAGRELGPVLVELQNRLFEVGADLAAPRPEDAGQAPKTSGPRAALRIGRNQIDELERQIDRICEPLPPMKHFVLPGGAESAARLHHARTVCRRAERLCVSLGRQEPIGDTLVPYLNRLSDLLFAMARWANQLESVDDVPWVGRGRKTGQAGNTGKQEI